MRFAWTIAVRETISSDHHLPAVSSFTRCVSNCDRPRLIASNRRCIISVIWKNLGHSVSWLIDVLRWYDDYEDWVILLMKNNSNSFDCNWGLLCYLEWRVNDGLIRRSCKLCRKLSRYFFRIDVTDVLDVKNSEVVVVDVSFHIKLYTLESN